MKQILLALFLAVCILVFAVQPGLLHAGELRSNAQFHQPFKLLPKVSDDDPYTLYFPFEVSHAGRVRVYIEQTGVAPGKGDAGRVMLADARIFDGLDLATWKKWIIKINKYNPAEWVAGDEIRSAVKYLTKVLNDLLGKEDKKPVWHHGQQDLSKTIPLVYDVDDNELRKTGGRYIVVLRNPSSRQYNGNVIITYPGDDWNVDPELEKSYPHKPDLAVDAIRLDGNNRVVVTVANHGWGLHKVRWNQQEDRAIYLQMQLDGNKWGGATLAEVDPQKQLSSSKSSITYNTGLVLMQPARVTALIDSNKVVAEDNEGNNRRTESLELNDGQRHKRQPEGQQSSTGGVGQTPAELPDLTVTDIFTDTRKRVAIRVANHGGRLPEGAWTGEPNVQLRLLMNGRSWAYVPLNSIDPQRVLRQKGSSVVYTTDLVVRNQVEITAIIDEMGRLQESNENNNTLIRSLLP
ncbi:MAG TPA: CARDB domain-containing protein [Dissulfurispiraceae bacterium]|nr:CARDB domain-containing protein [Dissulfurispiraceae bacterium]